MRAHDVPFDRECLSKMFASDVRVSEDRLRFAERDAALYLQRRVPPCARDGGRRDREDAIEAALERRRHGNQARDLARGDEVTATKSLVGERD